MKRVLSILLALTLLIGVVALASCGGTTPPAELEGTGDGTKGTTDTTVDFGNTGLGWDKARPGYEDVDFGGKTVKFSMPRPFRRSPSHWSGYVSTDRPRR